MNSLWLKIWINCHLYSISDKLSNRQTNSTSQNTRAKQKCREGMTVITNEEEGRKLTQKRCYARPVRYLFAQICSFASRERVDYISFDLVAFPNKSKTENRTTSSLIFCPNFLRVFSICGSCWQNLFSYCMIWTRLQKKIHFGKATKLKGIP